MIIMKKKIYLRREDKEKIKFVKMMNGFIYMGDIKEYDRGEKKNNGFVSKKLVIDF